MITPERCFLGWNRPFLYSVRDQLVTQFQRDSVLDLSAVIAVLPGNRAVRRLLNLLIDETEKRSLEFIPPLLITPGSLAEVLYPKALIASEHERTIAWVHAIKALSKEDRRIISTREFSEHDIIDWYRLAQRLQSIIGDMEEQLLVPEDVLNILSSSERFSDEARWEVLSNIYQDVQLSLSQHQFTSRVELLDVPSENLHFSQKNLSIILVNILDVSQLMYRLIEQNATDIQTYIFAPSSAAEEFDDWGRPLHSNTRKLCPSPCLNQISFVDTPSDQVPRVIDVLQALGPSCSPQSITVGTTKSDDVHTIVEALRSYSYSSRSGDGTPASLTSPVIFLNLVRNYFKNRSFNALSALCRHVDVEKYIGGSSIHSGDSIIRLLDWVAATSFPENVDTISDAAYTKVGWIIEKIDFLVSPLSHRKAPFEEWIEPLLTMLKNLYGEKQLIIGIESNRLVIEGCMAIRDVLGKLRSKHFVELTACDVIDIIVQLLQATPIPHVEETEAIECLGWLELALDDAPVSILLNCSEGYLPETVDTDPFLPDSLRQQLGLRCNQQRFFRDRFLLKTMLESKEITHFIVPKRSEEDELLLTSRLLLQESNPQSIAILREYLKPSSSDNYKIPLEQDRSSECSIPSSAPEIVELPLSVSVRGIELYAECPYRFYLAEVLKLISINDGAHELDSPSIGSLIHDVLYSFFSSRVNQAISDEIVKTLLELSQEYARNRFGSHLQAAIRLQLHQINKRWVNFAHWHANQYLEGWRIRYAEHAFENADLSSLIPGITLKLKGRIDRIDEHERTGAIRIIDYKTGKESVSPDKYHQSKTAWKKFQLPLYWGIMRHELGLTESQINTSELGFVQLSADIPHSVFHKATWSSDEIRDGIKATRPHLIGIQNGIFWPPTAPPFEGRTSVWSRRGSN